ncbi:hypothetical protein SynRS9909_00402 [Synechococcus sp. RS9909]|nr:hypothetical protein SynRS9909_00402 [Synechococcus sp. RS9909]
MHKLTIHPEAHSIRPPAQHQTGLRGLATPGRRTGDLQLQPTPTPPPRPGQQAPRMPVRPMLPAPRICQGRP